MINDGGLHESNAKGKAELFCSQYFFSLQTEEVVALD